MFPYLLSYVILFVMTSLFFRMKEGDHLRQGTLFIVCGCIGASIEFLVLTFLVELVHLAPQYAYLLSGLLSVTFVFFFNRFITFGGRKQVPGQSLRFILVYSFAFSANYLLTLVFFWIGVHYLLAKALAIGLIAFINFFLSKFFIFKAAHPSLFDVPVA